MSKKKKKEHHEEHADESWLVPYSDLLTLLLALFIVLYAMSSVDAQKFANLAAAFNKELTGGTGIFEYPSPTQSGEAETTEKEKAGEENEKTEEANKNANLSDEDLKEMQAKQDKEELHGIEQKVNNYIDKNNLTDKLEASLTDEGLLVSIRDNVLFSSGSADIRKQDVKTAQEISDLLVMNPPRNIVISGHTDNVPISNSKYSSNWELSVMRAISFMRILLENDKLNPQLFSAKGYGEFQPIASNKTSKGREKNRRVEILIMPRTTEN